MTAGDSYDMTFDDRVSPPLEDLVGRSVLLYCESSESEDAFPLKICTPITSSALTMGAMSEESGWTAGGVMAVILVILFGVGIGSAWYYSKQHPDTGDVQMSSRFVILAANSPTVTPPVTKPAGSGTSEFPKTTTPPPASTPTSTDDGVTTRAEGPVAMAAYMVDAGSPMGTMNEGGGYIETNEDSFVAPPPVPPVLPTEDSEDGAVTM